MDLKQKMKDEEWRYKTKRHKCIRTNKALAKAEIHTRKVNITQLINKMKALYEKQAAKEGGASQLKEMEKCFGFKREAGKDFVKIAKERFLPNEKGSK
jgi:RNase adaptor protein for sRNA GlmZ degradation